MTLELRFRKAARLPPKVVANPLAGLALPGDETALRQLYGDAVARLQTSARGEAVARLLGLDQVNLVVAGLDWAGWAQTLANAQNLYSKQIAAGALGSIAEVAPGLLVLVDHAFPKAVDLAQKEAAQMVSGLTDTSRAAVVDTLTAALKGGMSVDDTAGLLADVVGLNPRQGDALLRFERLQRAKGLTGGQLGSVVGRYRDALINDRANMIAVTEMSRAANMGRFQGYLEAAARGSIDAATVQKAVIVAPNCCTYCESMQIGEGLDGSFDPNDPSVLYPPFHPRCRCSFRIISG